MTPHVDRQTMGTGAEPRAEMVVVSWRDHFRSTLAYINRNRRLGKSEAQYMSVYEAVHLEGSDFSFGNQHLPKPYGRRREAKQCFKNALDLALKHTELVYCEGLAEAGSSKLSLLDHAWCLTADGRIVDPTWGYESGSTYLGIPLRTDFVDEIVAKQDRYSVFFTQKITLEAIRAAKVTVPGSPILL